MLVREIIHVRNMLQSPVYIDNESAITLCELLKTNHNTKHINMRLNFIRKCINSSIVALYFISSFKNVADIFTKPLQYKIYVQHRTILLTGHNGINPHNAQYVSYTMDNTKE